MEKLLMQRSGTQELGTMGRFGCAAVAGTVSALVASPTELIIIQQQVRVMGTATVDLIVKFDEGHTCPWYMLPPAGLLVTCVGASQQTDQRLRSLLGAARLTSQAVLTSPDIASSLKYLSVQTLQATA